MAREVLVSKFNFFTLKLWELARLFVAIACENLVFPPQKTKFEWDTSAKHKGIELLQFLLRNLWYKCLNWTELERLAESVFVVELKTSLARSLQTNCLRELGY